MVSERNNTNNSWRIRSNTTNFHTGISSVAKPDSLRSLRLKEHSTAIGLCPLLARAGQLQEDYEGQCFNNGWSENSPRSQHRQLPAQHRIDCTCCFFSLPAYCPFYNPIEVAFAYVKQHLQKNHDESLRRDRMEINEAFLALSKKDFSSTFLKCG